MPFSFGKLWNSFQPIPVGFGLDVSDRSLKFAQLARKDGGYIVKSFGERAFEKGIVEKGKVLAPERLGAEIRAALNDQNTVLPPYALLSLPEEEVFIRVIQMPHMSDVEMQEAVQWETEANIPLSIEDVYYDYQVLELPPGVQKVNHLDVMVAAAPRETVDGYAKALQGAGIAPVVIEPESASLVRSLVSDNAISDVVMLADVGVVRTRLVIYAAGAVRFTSFLTLSVESFLSALKTSLGVDIEEAQRILFSVGINRAARKGQIFEAVVSIITDLKEQMQKYMDFYLSHEQHEHRERVGFSDLLLAGGGALIPGLVDYLASELRVPVSVGNPWVNILGKTLEEIPEIPYREAIRYSAVLGLALRGAQPIKHLSDNTFYAG